MFTRRAFLATTAAVPLLNAQSSDLKIGVMDGVVRQSRQPEAIAVAKSFGVAGIQVTIGRPDDAGKLPLEDPAVQALYVAASAEHDFPINATYLDVLHSNCLKNDPLGADMVRRGIEITRSLNAKILMTVFFGRCSVLDGEELDYVADAFKEIVPEAEKAGVIIGFENLLTAEDQARAMDRVASDAFKIYYDVGNSTNRVDVDAVKEIRWLGADRICQFHFKDEGYLGEGNVDFPAVLEAIDAIGFEGYANLETNSPSRSMENDLRRNLDYLKGVMS